MVLEILLLGERSRSKDGVVRTTVPTGLGRIRKRGWMAPGFVREKIATGVTGRKSPAWVKQGGFKENKNLQDRGGKKKEGGLVL